MLLSIIHTAFPNNIEHKQDVPDEHYAPGGGKVMVTIILLRTYGGQQSC